MSRLVGWVAAGLLLAAVVRELSTPADQRQWHGRIAMVPYDLRPPTLARVRERIWAPESDQLIVPRVFGLGWTINLGRLVRLVTQGWRHRRH